MSYQMLKILALSSTVLLFPTMAAKAPLPGIDEWKTWSLEELEKQMSPSRWNPGKTPDQVIEEYTQITANGTEETRKSVAHELDIEYGSLTSEKFDVYGTDLPADAPILIWLHGGYWQAGSKDASGFFAKTLHSVQFRLIALGYTLAPQASIEKMEEELIAALKVATGRYPKAKFVVGGHSAGAHLAASILTGPALSELPNLASQLVGLYLVSGLYDLRPVVNTSNNIPLKLTPETSEALSPLFHDVQDGWHSVPLKILMVMGIHDSPEFQRQSTGYYELLKSQFPTTFWVSESDDHFTIVQKLMDAASPTANKLEEFLLQFHNIKDAAGAVTGLSRTTVVGLGTALFLAAGVLILTVL